MGERTADMAKRASSVAETKGAKQAKAAPALASASASSDPAVHQVLAEIDIASRNGNDEDVERLTEKLADLGYE